MPTIFCRGEKMLERLNLLILSTDLKWNQVGPSKQVYRKSILNVSYVEFFRCFKSISPIAMCKEKLPITVDKYIFGCQ